MHSQLSAILDFFNRTSNGTSDLPKINWDQYKANIHTPGVVDKIQKKYDEFMKTEYLADGAVSKCGVRTEAMKALDVAMHYNYQLWMAHYMMHLEQIETMTNAGDINMMSKMEVLELWPQAQQYTDMQNETGNIAPQDLHENSNVVRLVT